MITGHFQSSENMTKKGPAPGRTTTQGGRRQGTKIEGNTIERPKSKAGGAKKARQRASQGRRCPPMKGRTKGMPEGQSKWKAKQKWTDFSRLDFQRPSLKITLRKLD